MQDFKKVIKYFIPYLKKDRMKVFLIFLLYGMSTVLGGVITPVIYKKIIDALSDSPINQLLPLFITLVVITLIAFVVHRSGDYFLVHFQSKTLKDLYITSFKKLTLHSYNFFINSFSGGLVAKSKRFVNSFETIFDSILFSFYLTSIYIVGMFIVLINENIYLGMSFFVWMCFFFWVTFNMNMKKLPLNFASSQEDSKVSSYLSDVITNIANVKIFSSHEVEVKGFTNTAENDYLARKKQWMYDNKIWIVTGGLLLLFELLGVGLALFFWTKGLLSTGTVVLVQIYVGGLGRLLWNLGRSLIRFSTAVSEAIEFVIILDQNIEISDALNPEKLEISKGKIDFKNVSFTYPNGDHVFENFNLSIPAGQSVGIVGKSGSGKTTLTKILLRFYNIDSGEVSIDSQNISKVKQDDLRSVIAYIPQDTTLFHRSVYENIKYGNKDLDRLNIYNSSKSAHVDEFVDNLEHGYETEVGERGVKLSGGQRQRIGIARAMLKDKACLLVLDEATSSLDSLSEKYIQDSFEKLSKNRTTIVIAHRLSTIQKMDRIIVMDKGNIVEDGSHEELLKKGSYYTKLWNSQINGFVQDDIDE